MSAARSIFELVIEYGRWGGPGVIGVCEAGREPGSADEALVMLERALGFLATADAAGLPRDVQAGALLALERAEARHTAARARMLAAFTAACGYEDDGHGTARTWLRWRARVTRGATPPPAPATSTT